MARNRYPGTCYCCGNWVPTGFGHFERHNGGWRIKCVKCASGRPVDKKASEEFNRPAYQARKLIRTQGDYLQEDPNE